MAVIEGAALSVAIHATPASLHKVTLVEDTLTQRHARTTPGTTIGDLAYDSDSLDRQLAQCRIELIAPYRSNRIRPAKQVRVPNSVGAYAAFDLQLLHVSDQFRIELRPGLGFSNFISHNETNTTIRQMDTATLA